MENVVLIIHLILALSLIAVVLLQRSEGGGLGMGGGGAMTGRAAATAMSKITWILAAGFIVTSLSLTIIAAKNSADTSVLDRVGISSSSSQDSSTDAGTDTAPATAPDGGSLLPPPAGSSSGSDLTPSAD